MDRTWKPTAAGILCIVIGAIGMIPVIVLGLGWLLAPGGLLKAIGALLVVVGIMPIVGGIYALRRRRWGLALAGSIVIMIAPVILMAIIQLIVSWPTSPPVISAMLRSSPLGIPGILAIIFVIKGRREFK